MTMLSYGLDKEDAVVKPIKRRSHRPAHENKQLFKAQRVRAKQGQARYPPGGVD